jgi:EAL domain-containing protein (putative c-di-GMP-specific phosphodiesterase class I)
MATPNTWPPPAGEFIGLAEETGLILAIGDRVLNKACAQGRAWIDAGFAPITIAVNMSARQFRDKAVIETVVAALVESGLPPQYLEIEITESLLLHDIDTAIATMHGLTSLGVMLSLDGFGTGYSSLSRLKRFPISKLKIDKSFIDGVPGGKDDRAIVGAIVALAKVLELEVIAEGVEFVEQANFLTEVGCDVFQGYLFARPGPPVAIEPSLQREDSRADADTQVLVSA